MRIATSREHANGLAAGAMLVALPVLVGAAVSTEPRVAAAVVLLVAILVWRTLRGRQTWWDLTVFTVGGLYVLEYGFSNIGAPGPMPLPLVDLIAALLVVRIATRPGFRWPESLPFVLAAAFIALIIIRLAADFPQYGFLAIRDATLGVELAFLVVGYWAVKEYGLQRVIRVLSLVFVVGLVYLAFYPVRDAIAAASPQVGIQRPIPLIGNYFGSGVVATAAFFFFALMRPYGRWSYLLAAAALPMIVLLQSRGLYIAIPTAITMIWVLGRARAGTQARRGLAATLAIGLLALVVFFPLAPDEGRVGEVTPGFVVAQLSTLTGSEGPGAPVDQRTEWIEKVLSRVEETPWGWAVGVGLGPDLAFGFQNEAGVLIRKPHNDYLEIFARLGLLGFALFMGMMIAALTATVQGARRAQGHESHFLWFAAAQTVVLAMVAGAQPLVAFSYGTIPLFFVLGAALAIVEEQRAVESAERRRSLESHGHHKR